MACRSFIPCGAARLTLARPCCAGDCETARKRAPLRASGSHVAILLVAALLAGSPAEAQVAGSLQVATDDLFRGISLSDGEPVATAAISWDGASGVFLDGSATMLIGTDDSPGLLSASANLGYAARIAASRSVELGITRTQFTHRYARGRAVSYTDLYVGVDLGSLIARLHYSPDYFGRSPVAYAEINGATPISPRLRLFAHAGLSRRLDNAGLPGTRHDASVGMTRRLNTVELTASLVARQPLGAQSRARLVLSAAIAF